VTAEAVRDAAGELLYWLPAAEALITAQDAQGHAGRGQPSSRPPWNPQAASALLDALEGARRLEASWRSGRVRPMAATGAVLASIVRLSYGLPDCPPRSYDQQNRPLPCRCERCEAVRSLTRWKSQIFYLPAVDKEERPQHVPGKCPYCEFEMLSARVRERKVACLRGATRPPKCLDSDGNPPRGQMDYSQMDGTPAVFWADGLVT